MNRESNHNPALIQPVDKSSSISNELRCSSLITSLYIEVAGTIWKIRYMGYSIRLVLISILSSKSGVNK
jgi:hypothetical protein